MQWEDAEKEGGEYALSSRCSSSIRGGELLRGPELVPDAVAPERQAVGVGAVVAVAVLVEPDQPLLVGDVHLDGVVAGR